MTDDLSRTEIEAILRHNYGVQTVQNVVKLFPATNLVYRVDTPSERLVLKVYDMQDRAIVEQEVFLLNHLAAKDYPHPSMKSDTVAGRPLT